MPSSKTNLSALTPPFALTAEGGITRFVFPVSVKG